MSPSGSSRQISGTAASARFFWRRASRSRFAGSNTEPAANSLSARIRGTSGPWATRTVLVRKLKRLVGAIDLLASDLPKGQGWAYSRGLDNLMPQDGVFHVHQIYSAACPDYTGRATVPLLWDRERRTIVNN